MNDEITVSDFTLVNNKSKTRDAAHKKGLNIIYGIKGGSNENKTAHNKHQLTENTFLITGIANFIAFAKT